MTVLNELLEYLHLDVAQEEINENLQVHDIVLKCQALLSKEKSQIIKAFDIGNLIDTYSDGKEYFKANYK